MDYDLITEIVGDFANEYYPKGHDERGFALVCGALLLEHLLNDYDITRKSN